MTQIGTAAVQIGVTPSSQGAPRHPMTREREECLRRRTHRLSPAPTTGDDGGEGEEGAVTRRLGLEPLGRPRGGRRRGGMGWGVTAAMVGPPRLPSQGAAEGRDEI